MKGTEKLLLSLSFAFLFLYTLAKRVFLKNISNCESNIKIRPKAFWSFVKTVRGGSNYPKKLYLDGAEYIDGKDMCNAFGIFFQSVFGEPIRKNIPTQEHSLNITCVSNVQIPTMDVEKKLKALDINKGAGSNGLPAMFWSKCAESLAVPLFIIFNRSLREGIFPQKWNAHVVPVHK